MTLETIHFGKQIYGYAILALTIGSGLGVAGLFWAWFWKLFIPSRQFLKKPNRAKLLLLISWPLLIAGGGFWAGYQIGYRHFYSLRIGPDKDIVVRYLWPKGEVKISKEAVATIAVIHKGTLREGSDVLVIKTKTGRSFVSTAPVPYPEILPDKIHEAIGTGNSKTR